MQKGNTKQTTVNILQELSKLVALVSFSVIRQFRCYKAVKHSLKQTCEDCKY